MTRAARSWLIALAFAGLTAAAGADERKPRYPKPPDATGVQLVPDAWKAGPDKALTPAELDALLAAGHKADQVQPAPAAPDDVFLRRVYLDLTGKPPTPRQLREFRADASPEKRTKRIDELLSSKDYARHRARYWRDVLLSRATDNRVFVKIPREQALEAWLAEQFRDNASWGFIARALLTADGGVELQEPRTGGDSALLLCHTRDDGPVERTNDTARVFLGINLQCAQCHDHPDDVWKREHFHRMAAFFGRLSDRIRRADRDERINFQTLLFARPFGEYRMPDRDEPKKTTRVSPRFLTGEEPGDGLSDRARRKALAKYVTARENYYFAAAFVNRAWGELMGQAFVTPVDNLGPLQPAVYSDVLVRLAASFRAMDYDIKALYRLICNTQAYQRQMRLPDAPGEHARFAGSYPTRLRPEALWDSLQAALGPINDPVPNPGLESAPRRPFVPLAMVFKELFRFDPSAKPEDVEGSVPQALLLMNNRAINAQLKATGNTVLARVLKNFPKDGPAVEQLYLRTLGRSPSDRERRVCLEHVAGVGDRGAAFEDILWSLINSAEFRTKR
jgi:hypothetical protein